MEKEPDVSKNIVICCDRTANEFAANLTNVAWLEQCFTKSVIIPAIMQRFGNAALNS